MKKSQISFVALFAVLMLFGACRNNKNETEASTGANVASSTVTVSSDDWYWDNTSWRVDIDYDNITEDITDYGAVLVYMESQNTWRQLPMTFYYTDNDSEGNVIYCSSSLEVSTYDKGLSIFWTENDFYDGYRPDEHRFKIVVIEANIYAARSDVDFSDYNAVRTAFGITEDKDIELIK